MKKNLQKKQIGILGGSFNPIHLAHVMVAEKVIDACNLDELVFMPALNPPHKIGVTLLDGSKRLEMVRLVTDKNPRFRVSDLELKRGGVSYTIDTIKEFKRAEDCELSLIIGSDQFLEIATWRSVGEILTLSNLIVVGRPGFEFKEIAGILPVELTALFCYDDISRSWKNTLGYSITQIDIVPSEISASLIRERIASGEDISEMVPPEVLEFIKDRGLYL